jgi:folate-dependent phosphoribosylglycinamide formyltransferase PurN
MTSADSAPLRIAILTTPEGIFTAHYLVKNLAIAGILIDRGKIVSKEPKLTFMEKVEYHHLRGGPQEVLGAIGGKFLRGFLGKDSSDRANALENAYWQEIDRIFLGHPFFQRKLEQRDFVRWDELASYYRIPTIYVDNINDETSAQTLREWKADLAIMAGGRLLKPHIIVIPRLGILNKHSSILPKHRGVAAEYWCLYHEDFDSLGVTVHFVEKGLDSGPILCQKKILFEKGDTPRSLRFKSNVVGREAIVEAVQMIATTGATGTPQDETAATRNKQPTLASDRELYAKLPRLWEKYGA